MDKLNRIKAVLAEHGKNSKWLSEQVGKSSCAVSKWYQNSIHSNLKTLNYIADIFI